MTMEDDWLGDWVLNDLRKLAEGAPFGQGRVALGLGFDAFMLPKEQVIPFYEEARELGVKVITTHYVRKYAG